MVRHGFNTRSATEMVDSLKAAGHRITRQRVTIIELLAKRTDHPSAHQIHAALKGRDQSVSLATVYNTLATLVEAGLIVEIDFESTNNRFDTNLEPHLNLICSGCGSIHDVSHRLPVPPMSIRQRFGFETTEIRMEYRGKCAKCRSK